MSELADLELCERALCEISERGIVKLGIYPGVWC